MGISHTLGELQLGIGFERHTVMVGAIVQVTCRRTCPVQMPTLLRAKVGSKSSNSMKRARVPACARMYSTSHNCR
jgi:hypothetical protein